ncbi:MAG: FAD:protein FMN transferase [Candidatus Hydrogenedentes bacterium]|nr:FAD:protein FMN transferase [Candidatus Hydrogenedentota bacterium]
MFNLKRLTFFRRLLLKERVGALIICWVVGGLLASCSSPQYPYKIYALTGETMGTTYHIKIVLPTDKNLPENIGNEVHSCLEKIDSLMSTYQEDSELMQFNRHKEGTPFPVSEETKKVFEIAMKVAEETDGAFDITVYPLVELWGFGKREVSAPPSEDVIKQVLANVGYKKLKILPEGLKKEDTEMQCDLSAVAKGYAVDKVCELLDLKGMGSYMVEVGGEVKVKGEKLPGQPWIVGIEYPEPMSRKVFKRVQLKDYAMATSGNYRNYFIWNGKRYSHEIDPITGYPVPHTLASVSVVHRSCAFADAYATAFMVMGLEKAYKFAEEHNIPAFFIYPENGVTFSYKETSSWKNYRL